MTEGEALIHLRVPAATKARWVRESRAAGMRLTDWIVARIDGQKGEKTMIRTQYTIRPTVLTTDTRAAADACNRELMAAGDTYSREAAEEKIKECAPSLREWLTIEAEDVEAWEAWEDGARDDAVRFIIPAGGVVDIAEAGAAALGVDVSERLNVDRV